MYAKTEKPNNLNAENLAKTEGQVNMSELIKSKELRNDQSNYNKRQAAV